MKELLLIFALLVGLAGQAQEIRLRNGLRLTRSATIKKEVYRLAAGEKISKPLIVIQGKNIVIDFNGAELAGADSATTPDAFKGLAILVRKGSKVTIRNLRARGYKIGLMAENVGELLVEGCDFSYNYRQRLKSTPEKEDDSDWLSYHKNEKDEWLRYGAGIYLKNCTDATVRGCTVTNGLNGLLLTGCNNALVYNSNFSFNSGLGIGLYRSAGNKILYNKLDFNVRGYSHGIYSRGQDSGGILLFEQSSGNLVYKNSATHSGDGLFLWAGQSTLDKGRGGSNDNLIMDNDFSYAPANGVEATFSRNRIIHNRIYECSFGVWGGYSFDTEISGNQFRNNRTAIAIEHGQQNRIHHNLFFGDSTAIRLWANAQQPADWGYVKYRDTRSVGTVIVGNSYNRNNRVYVLARTDSLRIFDNQSTGADLEFVMDSTVTNLRTDPDDELLFRLSEEYKPELPIIADPMDPFKGNGRLAGRKTILVTAWGPYNYGYPLIWNEQSLAAGDTLSLQLLGPAGGSWKLEKADGLAGLSATEGGFPFSLRAQRTGAPVRLELAYTGPAFLDAFGHRVAEGVPYRFSYMKN